MQISKLTIDNVTWTPVVVAVGCDVVILRNDTATTKIRTNATDANSEDSFVQGVQYFCNMQASNGMQRPKFGGGETIAYLQAVSGTGPVIMTIS